MSVSTTTVSSGNGFATHAFWERLWRTSGLLFVGLFIVTFIIYGYQPPLGASADDLTAFYSGDRTRVLISAFLSGLNLLNLLWFMAALRAALAEAGQDGWGAAAIVSSAAFAALSLLQIAVAAALAYSIARAGDGAVTSALNDFSWALIVLTSFPRAMMIMAGAFGLWRAGLVSNTIFAAGVAAVVLAVLGGSAWLTGSWAPDGAYSRFISPTLLLIWLLVLSRVLLGKSPAGRTGW